MLRSGQHGLEKDIVVSLFWLNLNSLKNSPFDDRLTNPNIKHYPVNLNGDGAVLIQKLVNAGQCIRSCIDTLPS